MSRGMGWVQQAIIAKLKQVTSSTTLELAAYAYGCEIEELTPNQIIYARDSLYRLAKRRTVKEGDYHFDGHSTWMLVNARPNQTHRQRHAPGQKLRVVLGAAREPDEGRNAADKVDRKRG